MWKYIILAILLTLQCSAVFAQEKNNGNSAEEILKGAGIGTSVEELCKYIISDESEIKKLISDLGNDEWRIREAATKELIQKGHSCKPYVKAAKNNSSDVEVVSRADRILKALSTRIDVEKRKLLIAAIAVLGKSKNERAIAPLLFLLSYGEHHDISQPCWAALNQWDKSTLPGFIKALEDQNLIGREYVPWILWRIGDKSAVQPLVNALNDNEKGVCANAAQVLGKMKVKPTVPVLLKALKNKVPEVRLFAINASENLSDKSLIQALRVCLQDEVQEVRMAATKILDEMRDESSLPAFIEALCNEEEDEEDTRLALIIAIGRFKNKIACPALVKALEDPSYNVAHRAAYELGEIGDKSIIPKLIETLKKTKDSGHRIALIEALGYMKATSAVELLIKFMEDDKNNQICTAIMAALGRIGSKSSGPALLHKLSDKNETIRTAAADALGDTKYKEATPALINILINDKSEYLRQRVIVALGKIGDISAVPHLIEALKDKSYTIRRIAAGALGMIGDGSAVSALILALNDNDKFVRQFAADSLCEIRDKDVVPELIKVLDNKNPESVKAALRAMGKIKDNRAIPVLITALKKRRPIIFEIAFALKQITGKDFGTDIAKWEGWWETNKDRILKEEAEKEKAAPEK